MRHAWVLSRRLLLLEVLLVVQGRFWRHVRLRYTAAWWHARLTSGDLGVIVLGRLDGVVPVYAVGVITRRLRRIQAGLDEVLSFGLRDEWLQLGGRERVDKASLGHDKQQYLGAGKDG